MSHIYPIFDQILQKSEKESLLKQKAKVFWMVGLSGSGKSTLAKALERELHKLGHLTMLLDGDNLRTGLNNNLSFSDSDRLENIRRAAEVAKLFVECGVVTICSFISPTVEIRKLAEKVIGGENFKEVYVNAPLEICEQRDVKGLYKKARNGEIKNFTGLDSPFEEPQNAWLEIKTAELDFDDCVEKLLKEVKKEIQL
ncbi:MAG: adenylyl-sulfate kinase [Cytophagales bacterium]